MRFTGYLSPRFCFLRFQPDRISSTTIGSIQRHQRPDNDKQPAKPFLSPRCPRVYRESRSYTRERESDSDDEEYKKTTVRRYKVTPSRVERVERVERDIVVDDDRRSHFSSHLAAPGRSSQADLLEVDRRVERVYVPERPRSAFDPSPAIATRSWRGSSATAPGMSTTPGPSTGTTARTVAA